MTEPKGLLAGTRGIMYYPELGQCFGVCEALLIQQIHFRCSVNGHQIDGNLWMWNSVKDWSQEIRMSEATVKRALSNLEKIGVVHSGVFNRHKYDRTKWYRVNYEALELLLVGLPTEKPDNPPLGQKEPNPLGQNDPMATVKKTQPIPEIYSEMYTEMSLASPELKTEPTNEGREEMEVKKNRVKKGVTSSSSAMNLLAKTSPNYENPSVAGMTSVWVHTVPKHCEGVKFIPEFTQKQKGQLKRLSTMWGKDSCRVLEFVLSNWIKFCKHVSEQTGVKSFPMVPNHDYLLKHGGIALNLYASDQVEDTPPVQLIALVKPSSLPCCGKITIKRAGKALEKKEKPAEVVEVGEEDPMTLEELLAFKPLVTSK